jgi:hypothetical protein
VSLSLASIRQRYRDKTAQPSGLRFEHARARAAQEGIDLVECLIQPDESAAAQIRGSLQDGDWDAVVIGGGIRKPEPALELVEYVVNLAHCHALPRFERDWKNLSIQQRATFRKVVMDAFVPDLTAPDRPFRPGLRVTGVTAHPGVFEMTGDNDGRAMFSYGEEQVPGQAHVIWRRIGTHAIFAPPPGP